MLGFSVVGEKEICEVNTLMAEEVNLVMIGHKYKKSHAYPI